MVEKVLRRIVLIVIAILVTSSGFQTVKMASSVSDSSGWAPVEQAMGKQGTLQGDVLKFSMPRGDLKITVGDIQISPALALGSWVAFKKMGSGAMVMGDLVLTEKEVGPVMKKLEQGGIEITALHNHLLGESPRVMYMHIEGQGDPATMAKSIRDALALTGTPFGNPGTKNFSSSMVDTAQLDNILGYKGKVNGDVYQFSVPRSEKITDQGVEVPPSMGVAMPINFQPTGNGKAAIAGDMVLTADEVNPVIRSLNDHGIDVTAVHSHMLTEEPRLFFLHFWANDDAYKLAKGLRAALNETNASPA
jgi:biotin operon repressor